MLLKYQNQQWIDFCKYFLYKKRCSLLFCAMDSSKAFWSLMSFTRVGHQKCCCTTKRVRATPGWQVRWEEWHHWKAEWTEWSLLHSTNLCKFDLAAADTSTHTNTLPSTLSVHTELQPVHTRSVLRSVLSSTEVNGELWSPQDLFVY